MGFDLQSRMIGQSGVNRFRDDQLGFNCDAMNGKSTNNGRRAHGVVFLLLLVLSAILPFSHAWPLFWAVPLALYGTLVAIIPMLRRSLVPWHIGDMGPRPASLAIVIAVVSSVELLMY